MDIIKNINKSNNAIWTILPKLSISDLENIIKLSADSYYNTGISLVTDTIYDILVTRLETLNPTSKILKKTGSTIKGKKVKLPYWMGSMDKIKTEEKVLNNWLVNHTGPYLISDKLDGISCLIIVDTNIKLYTRGDGEYGQDITHLLKLINIKIPKIDMKVAIRGELIMSKQNFNKYSSIMANARNMVSGIVNSKPSSVNLTYAKDVDFIAYEIIDPNYIPLNQMTIMNKLGFNVVNYKVYNSINLEKLNTILKKNKSVSLYEIDGIIITNNVTYTRNKSGNPDYSFAFKGVTETCNTEVIDVLWKPAKDGHIIPRIHFKKVKLSGVDIEYTAGFNAKFINDNLIGPGAIITITRSGDTIPYITGIVTPAKKPALPKNLDYEWDDSEVNLVLTKPNNNADVIISRITKFVRDLGIENMSEGIVTKIYNAGYDTIPAIIQLTKDELVEIDGFQDTLAEKIINNMADKLKQLDLLTLMVASNSFGRGFGSRKIKPILNVYPDIVDLYTPHFSKKWIDAIIEIDGYDMITATKFIENLTDFQEFYNEIKKIISVKPYKKVTNSNQIFKDQIIVFTGFRNKDWIPIIEANGGKVSTSVSRNTTLLVYADGDEGSSKYLAGKKLGITMMTKQAFSTKYGL